MSKKILAFILTLAMVCSLCLTPALAAEETQTQSVTFADAQGNWAESSINRWAASGVVTGDNNGNVNPSQYLTRAELATMLVRLLGLSDKAPADTFSDVAADAWYADAVLKCAAAGIMQGWDGKADPEDPITREQAITMVGRALGTKAKTSQSLAKFADADQVADYAAQYMAPLTAMGILSGVEDGSKVAPKANIDRASALALLDKAIAAYVTEPGEVKVNDTNKYVVVNSAAAGDVTVSGTTAGVLVTNGNKANVKLNNVVADTVKVDSVVAVDVVNGSKVGDMDVNAPATVNVDRTSKVNAVDTTDAGDANVNNNQTSSGRPGGSGGGTTTPTGTAYKITVDTAIVNGAVSVRPTSARKGTTVTVTVTPDEGYELDTLTANGVAVTEKDGKYTFVMPDEAVTVTATFKAVGGEPAETTYDVTVDTVTNGTVTADPTSAKAGASVTLTVAPAEGYELETLTVDGKDVTAQVKDGKYTFEMPAKAVAVSATFKTTAPVVAADYTLTIDDVFASVKANPAEGWVGETDKNTAEKAAALVGLGTDKMFTLYPKSTGGSQFRTAAGDAATAFGDFKPTYRFTFGGKMSLGDALDTPSNCIKFTTDGAVTVRLYWVGGTSSSERHMAILNAEGTEVAVSAEGATSKQHVVSELKLTESGTYYVGPKENSNHLYKIEVVGKLVGETEAPVEETYTVSVDTQSKLLAVETSAKTVTGSDTDVTVTISGATYTVGNDTAVYTIGKDTDGIYVVAGDANYYITATVNGEKIDLSLSNGKVTGTFKPVDAKATNKELAIVVKAEEKKA